jgi:antitoxin CptB
VDANDPVTLSRLRWQCRRGMRELDELLLRYVERRLPRATQGERDAFARLLDLPDPDLFGYLVGQRPQGPTGNPVLEDVVARIRNDEA